MPVVRGRDQLSILARLDCVPVKSFRCVIYTVHFGACGIAYRLKRLAMLLALGQDSVHVHDRPRCQAASPLGLATGALGLVCTGLCIRDVLWSDFLTL